MATPIQVRDILYNGFRIAGILLGAGQSYSVDDEPEGLNALNGMLNTWKAQRLTVFAILRTLFTMIPGKGSEANPYIIGLDTGTGSSGIPDIVIERPEKIEYASYVLQTNPTVEVPLEIVNDQQWQAVAPKDLTGPIPSLLYYRPTVPNGRLILWVVPTEANQLALYTWQTVNEFATVTDPVILPPAYREAIEYNLALRLATRYPEAQMNQAAVDLARSSFAWLKSINTADQIMQCEAANRTTGIAGRYNIFSNRNTPIP
jgi:hypothetical protein